MQGRSCHLGDFLLGLMGKVENYIHYWSFRCILYPILYYTYYMFSIDSEESLQLGREFTQEFITSMENMADVTDYGNECV